METLIQTILKEVPETVTTTHILQVVPRFIQEAQAMTVPGADKKAMVLKALHDLVDTLKESPEMHAFVDVAIAPTIDMLIDVAKGRVSLSAPKTVEEVAQKVNCLLQVVQGVLGLLKPKVPVAAPAPAPVAATENVVAAEPEVPETVEPSEPEVKVVAEEVAIAAKAAEIAQSSIAEAEAEAEAEVA